MSTTSGPEQLPYPQPSDTPDGPGAFLALLQAMQTAGPWVYGTLAALQAVAGKYVNQLATVNADTPANNGYYSWNGSTWVPLNFYTGGLNLIAPSSVTGSGVSIGNIGHVALSAAPRASVNGVFTSRFDNYLIKANLTLSTAGLVELVFRAAGVDVTSPNYNYQAFQGSGSTTLAAGTSSAATAAFLTNTALISPDCTVDVEAPALAANTRFSSKFYGMSGATQAIGLISGTLGLASAVDGFTLIPASGGTISGDIRVFGYNNA